MSALAPEPWTHGHRRPGTEGLILVATLALVAFYYVTRADTIGVLRQGEWNAMTLHPLGATLHFAWSGMVLGVLPVAAARLGLGIRCGDLGLGWGRWRVGLLLLGIGLPVAVLAGWIGAASTGVRAVYPLDTGLSMSDFVGHAAAQWLYFGAWEVLFRGVLLFGLAPRIGAGSANLVQTALSVVAHFGRPIEETLAAIPAGLAFGAIDLRIRSIWYVALLHWVEGVALDYFILTGMAAGTVS